MKWMKTLWALLVGIFRKNRNPFALTEKLSAFVSPTELHVYRLDADRNGKTLGEWVRSTLNAGVSRDTLVHLSKGSAARQDALDAVYNMLDAEDRAYEGAPILPIRNEVRMSNKKVSGHPCRHLDPQIPPNYTAADCQGVCTNRKPGMNGRPCFWGALAASQCSGFERKRVLPLGLPTKNG